MNTAIGVEKFTDMGEGLAGGIAGLRGSAGMPEGSSLSALSRLSSLEAAPHAHNRELVVWVNTMVLFMQSCHTVHTCVCTCGSHAQAGAEAGSGRGAGAGAAAAHEPGRRHVPGRCAANIMCLDFPSTIRPCSRPQSAVLCRGAMKSVMVTFCTAAHATHCEH